MENREKTPFEIEMERKKTPEEYKKMFEEIAKSETTEDLEKSVKVFTQYLADWKKIQRKYWKKSPNLEEEIKDLEETYIDNLESEVLVFQAELEKRKKQGESASLDGAQL